MHAAVDWAFAHPKIAVGWHDKSNYIVVLVVKNEQLLNKLLTKAKEKNIICLPFVEPDLDNQLTAIALSPGDKSKRLCSNLKLMGI